MSVAGSSIAFPTEGRTCMRILNAENRLSDLRETFERKLD